MLLERDQLTCGTTWHAAGLTQLRSNENIGKLAQYSAQLFHDLGQLTGHPTGFRQSGSITLESTPARIEELKRGASMGRSFGLEVEMIEQPKPKRVPLLDVSDVLGAAWIASDGMTNPIDTAQAFAAGARQGGAKLLERSAVTRIVTKKGQFVGVETGEGWSAPRKRSSVPACGVAAELVPLYAAQHLYVVTEAIPGLPADLPTIRDMDARVYAKLDAGLLRSACQAMGNDASPMISASIYCRMTLTI
ncbi:FAD-dependent oxidoreductase [Mesorhizobium sp.]|uniref:NAD(P)/FAD-dependent oxidoreductase n=1 Tax=Mesorhizobium sp. TaxID=1871066 RepID=UPI000FE76D19|nr:MAG: FAD-binding oxidoreductase [Mesorhizobium sp.]